MGGKNTGSSEAAQARADEQARQAKIREGTARINSIFDGGTVGSGLLGSSASYDPTATYYNKDGSVWTPTAYTAPTTSGTSGLPTNGSGMSWMSNSGSQATSGSQAGGMSGADASSPFAWHKPGANLSPAEQFAQAVKNGTLYSGKTTTPGFNNDFYSARRQAYIDYASPQVEDQYSKANKELTYALARGGNLNSSVRGEKAADLQKLYDLNMQDAADKALSYETQARNNVEDARANLITTLNATGDAEQAASSAIARSQALSQPAAYSPLGQLFADFTNTLGIQAAQERAAAASGGTYKSPYNTGLFGTTGRVSVTN